MADNIHSTGRGGAGNIGEDASTYVDGEIVREAPAQGGEGGEYHGGRGGVGNIAGSSRSGNAAQPGEDVVPEPAMRTAEGHENFHTGRGGEGNIHKDKYGGHSHKQGESLIDRAKHAIGLDKDKKHEQTKEATS